MTAKEYIKEHMPEPYLSSALENIEKFPFKPDKSATSMQDAIFYAFMWEESAQGWFFWEDCSFEADASKWGELPSNIPPDPEQKEEPKADRKDVLLKAAYDLLKAQDDSRTVLNLLEVTVPYDGTDCDGYCLMADICSELDLEDD